MSSLPKFTLPQIAFETEVKDAKGASTEDAGLKIVAKFAKEHEKHAFVVERPSPPNIGEFDAICCTDSGIIFIELKRYGGSFYDFETLDPQVCIRSGNRDKWLTNPSVRLSEKSKRLAKEIFHDDGWVRVKRVFSGHIPIYNVVCYGPSTEFNMVPEKKQGNHICNTRTLYRTLREIYMLRPGVIGAGAQMASMVSTWVQWGVLTTNQKGFLRCSVSCITSSQYDATPWGLQSLQSDGKKLFLEYVNGVKETLPFDGEVQLKAYVEGDERSVMIECGTRFRWRIHGR